MEQWGIRGQWVLQGGGAPPRVPPAPCLSRTPQGSPWQTSTLTPAPTTPGVPRNGPGEGIPTKASQ